MMKRYLMIMKENTIVQFLITSTYVYELLHSSNIILNSLEWHRKLVQYEIILWIASLSRSLSQLFQCGIQFSQNYKLRN